MPPAGMYINKDQYPCSTKIATRCYITKAVMEIEKRLDKDELDWFRDHQQFQHFFHMPRDKTHKSMGMWMLILRMVRTEKKKEIWFLVNGVPIRYSMREHAIISGLFCHDYPRNHEEIGNLKFVHKYFPNEPKVTQEMVEEKFLAMKTRKKGDDRLKMAVLYFLTHVIKGSAKRGKDAPDVDKILQRIVMDLNECRVYPWGRYTFLDTLSEVGRMVALFEDGVVNAGCNLPCFIAPLELLAFEAIPNLGNYFRIDVKNADKRCPRMCKRKFKSWSMRGFPIEAIYRELGETTEIDSILQVTLEERHLVADMVAEDDDLDAVVDGWTQRLTVEHQPVFFEDLLREDIEMRTVPVVEEEKAEEEPTVGDTSDAPSGVLLGQRQFQEVMLAGLNALNQMVAESRELVVAGFKEIKEEMKSLNERVTGVEKFVSEYRMEKSVEEEDGLVGIGVEVEKDVSGEQIVEKDGGGNKQKKRKTHSALTKPPYGRPNTRQKTTKEGTTEDN